MNNGENIYQGFAVVVMHANGGFMKVPLEATLGIGLANGGINGDTQTAKIPCNLKNIGSRFYLEVKREGDFVFRGI